MGASTGDSRLAQRGITGRLRLSFNGNALGGCDDDAFVFGVSDVFSDVVVVGAVCTAGAEVVEDVIEDSLVFVLEILVFCCWCVVDWVVSLASTATSSSSE